MWHASCILLGSAVSINIKCVTGILFLFVSTDVEFECPILKVVYNKANKDFNEMGVMVKGTIVEVDSNPFKTW